MSKHPGIPILMYHALAEQRDPFASPLHLSPDMFRRQIEWLASNRYQAITPDELPSKLSKNKDGDKFCLISFDDGYHSLFVHAAPLLKKYGFAATLYLTAAITGQNNFDAMQGVDPVTIPAGDRPLSWQEVKEMAANGWSVQSHSVSHADHSRLSSDQMLQELNESKRIIEQQTGQPVHHYAFPFGKYNAAALKMVKEAGYKSAATVHSGLCSATGDPYRLPRLELNINDTMTGFINKIEKGFVSPKQKIRSSIRNILFKNPVVKDISKKISGGHIN